MARPDAHRSRGPRLDRRRCMTLGAALLAAGPARLASAQEYGLFRLGTGGVAGTYYPIGALIANIISNPPGGRACEDGGSCGVPGLIAVAQSSAGSLENIQRIEDGTFEGGLAQSDVAYAAYAATGLFEGAAPAENLRTVASLYVESMHIVAAKTAEIETVAALRGKRVAIDVPDSGTQPDARLVLDVHGLRPADLDLVETSGLEAATMLRGGGLDAFFYLAGWPALLVSDLADEGSIRLLPIDDAARIELAARQPLFSDDLIPFGAYKDLPATKTVGMTSQFLVSAKLDPDLVHGITAALWHPASRLLLDQSHPKAREITLDTAVEAYGVPLHEGAARYYEEAGIALP